MNLKLWLCCALTFGLAQIAFGQQPSVPQSPLALKDDSGYLVGIGDEVTGKVLGETQFDFVSEVDTDGKLQIPFFDKSIQAKCRTEKELRADVTQILSKYLKSPQISVRVTTRRSRPPAVIYGEVRSPKEVDLRRQARLLDMLSLAGGITDQAGGTIQIFRTQRPMCSENPEDVNLAANPLDEAPRVYSLSNLREGRDEYNPIIYPGDLIVVDKSPLIYVTGEVNTPREIYLKEGNTTLMDAIAKVNGVRREAKTKDIKIYRVKPNASPQDNRDVITANYDLIKKGEQKDIVLQPNDIIIVDKAKKSVGQIALELATGGVRTVITSAGTGIIP